MLYVGIRRVVVVIDDRDRTSNVEDYDDGADWETSGKPVFITSYKIINTIGI